MQPIVEHVWREKYRHGDEKDREATLNRVVDAVCVYEDPAWRERIRTATFSLRWCPAGRIVAGAGTNKRVTLINCYVSPTIQDSMRTEHDPNHPNKQENSTGILDALTVAALTQQMGGGIGMDFSTLRPAGATLHNSGSIASGPLPFMDMWNAMCATVMSSGARRGAMMATLRCDHPDIEAFITAKREPGRLTNFNVSVLITDTFMEAVMADESWPLTFDIPRHNSNFENLGAPDHPFIYKVLRARELWDLILRNTYDHAEPGVIFIDRVNALNNLNYCETISTTNPCSEQPLPPNGACNLGAVNLALHVIEPFTDEARVNYLLLTETVRCGVRFLDNVHDITKHPTQAQAAEANQKRRIGLGVTGLGSMLQQLQIRYGSERAVTTTEKIMQHIANVAYEESAQLAKERGPFPLYDQKEFNTEMLTKLSDRTQKNIAEHGLRNGVLLTVAPTGTTSIFYDNVSSGIEPTYSWKATRKVLQSDGSRKEFQVYDWGIQKYAEAKGFNLNDVLQMKELPNYLVTAEELTVNEHLDMQAAAQRWVDASISKTLNVPENLPYEKFKHVYERAYEIGCKGVTTYRPSPTRGAVLTKEIIPAEHSAPQISELPKPEDKTKEVTLHNIAKRPRPDVLPGRTYKVKWPHSEKAYYITVNDGPDGVPFEIFVTGGDETQRVWSGALARFISALLRRGDSVDFVIEELEQIHDTTGGAHMGKRFRYVPSAPALLGKVLREHVSGLNRTEESADLAPHVDVKHACCARCPKCGDLSLLKISGCDTCVVCGYSKCE